MLAGRHSDTGFGLLIMPAATARPRRLWALLPVFIVAHFAHHVGTGALTPLLPLIRTEFQLGYAGAGVLVSAFTLSLGFGQLPISMLGDRLDKRLLVGIGLVGVGVSGVVIGLSQAYWLILVLFVGLGLCAATYHAPAAAYLAGAFGTAGRGRALGTHVIGGALAFAVTPALAVLVATLAGSWRTAFLVLAVVPLAAGLALLGLIRHTPDQRTTRPAGSVFRREALAALRAIGALVAVALLLQLLSTGIMTFLPLFMTDQHGIPESLAGLFITLMAGIGVVGAPLGGWLSDRLGRAPVILWALVVVGPSVLALAYVPYGVWLFVILAIYGLSLSIRMPVIESLFADTVPAHRRATALGLYYFVGQEVNGVATPAVGQLVDATSPTTAFGILGLVGCALSVVLLVGRRQLITAALAGAPAQS